METVPAATILICEDDEMVRRLMVRTLRGAGHLILDAATGREAVAAAGRMGADLAVLITDVVLPDATGSEVARLVQTHAPDVEVLFTSGHSAEVAERLGISLQSRNFIAKPFSPAELVGHVQEALTRHGSTGQERA